MRNWRSTNSYIAHVTTTPCFCWRASVLVDLSKWFFLRISMLCAYLASPESLTSEAIGGFLPVDIIVL